MNKEQLRDEFSAGMRSWGAHNLPSARSNFKWCASLDPNSNDVIRAMSAMENGGEGPATPEQIERLWQTRESYGELLVASGYPPDLISASYATGMWGRDQKLRTKADTPLAYACLLIQRESWEEASKVLKEANSGIPFTSIVKGFLNYRTKRWGDVLSHCDEVATASLFNDQDRLVEPLVADVLVQGLSSLMAGEALTHLERYESAIARLEFATGVSDNLISARAYYITGLAYRAKGDEDNAQRAFALSLARNNDAEVVKAAEDENVRISTTSEEMISARSDPWDHHTEPSLVKKREDASEDERKRLLREADEELDSFIGMDSVKHQIRKLKARVKAAQERDARGLKSGSASQHILFTGPPGTGKTTIARVIGKLYAGLGITRSSQVLETGRPDLVGETVGSSALKTRALINKARGGLLFIDEAYSLVQEISQTQKDAFGKEALDVIVAEMENNRDDLVVIMAGYPQDIERLLATNEGLKSRFPRSIEFQSYTAEELWKIACGMAEANGSVLSPDAEHILREKVRNPLMTRNHEGKLLLDLAGNGRFVRNVVERAEEERELRLLDEADARGISMGEFTDQELVTISPVDVETALEAIILKYLD